ncbi:uncharacterized protein N0V89_011292 [Didymosphaeria variabile]|uniref:Cytochrome P450 n=1 Tax=Didymosphaeria variabile TaxID=1932322 RepID=A0A9W8XCU5_9PLEO|nr:uncharacterized protein N0V89_011292 [Didymosphaeria variabile]KAJ4347351.1 hypothetical protein N0V89_011292 [Didymosphaeria variabile]
MSSPSPQRISAQSIAGKTGASNPLRKRGTEEFCGAGFLTTDGDVWRHSRRDIKPTFTGPNLVELDVLATEVDHFLDQLPDAGATIDLQPLFYTMFLNTSLHFLVGIDPRQEAPGAPCTPAKFIDAFHEAKDLTMLRMLLGRAWKLVPQFRYLNACRTTHEYIDYYVDQAQRELDKVTGISILHVLAKQTDDKEYIRNQILQGMLASQETTSALLGNACFLLARHPQYWTNLRSLALSKNIQEWTFDTLSTCKPIQNILLETLRLYPNFPIMACRALRHTTLPISSSSSTQDQPVFIPKGTEAVMSYYALHRDPSVFGADVETFKPERWNEIKPGQWEYMAFGGGNRACMGQSKVLVEAAYVLVRMARRYEMIESRDGKAWKGDVKLTCKDANGVR